MWGKIKLRRADTLFSLYLRKKRGYRCEYCGGFWPEGKGLTLSHFWTRAKESVRFDEEKTDILCVNDHRYFEEHKTEYHEWKRNRMGKKAFDLLMLRAHTYRKKDDTPILMWLKQEMKKP